VILKNVFAYFDLCILIKKLKKRKIKTMRKTTKKKGKRK